MTHSGKTADKFYNIQHKGKNDAKTVKQLRLVLRRNRASEANASDIPEGSVSSRRNFGTKNS